MARKPVDRVPISIYELCPYEGSDCASFANHEPSYSQLLAMMAEKTDTIMMSSPIERYPMMERITEKSTWREGGSLFEKTILAMRACEADVEAQAR